MQVDAWVLVVVAVGAFVLGRMTAKSPIDRDRETRDDAAAQRRNRAAMKPELLAEVRGLIGQNRRIEAIKLVRAELGIDLKAAKDLVEALDA